MRTIILLMFFGAALSLPAGCTRDVTPPAPRHINAVPEAADGAGNRTPGSDSTPVVTSAVVVPSNPTAGTSLGLRFETRNPTGGPVSYRFRWFIDNTLMLEGPDSTLAPGTYRKGSGVHAEVIPSSSSGAGQPFSTAPVTILNTQPAITGLAVKPFPAYSGMVLTAYPVAKDPDGDLVMFSYQWKINGASPADPANTETFDTRNLRKGDVVSVTVVPSDGEASGIPVIAKVTLLNSPPRITSSAPAAPSEGIYTYQVAASDPDGDPLVYSLAAAPPGMSIDSATGLIRWELPREVSGRQEVPVKVQADDRDGGIAYQEFSLFLEMK